jgi:SAM-dependent methyltransferase
MDPATIQRLNQINHNFYARTAAAFDATRGRPWPGWERLLPHLPPDMPLTVLDAGCGNGRFGVFLAERRDGPIIYHGVDSNADLLELAESALSPMPDLTVTLEQRDVIDAPPTGTYGLVTAFGLLHHVPGYANRQAFVRSLAGCVADGGLLAFATWRFHEFDRFRERIVPWPDDLAQTVEAHDYLLDWRRGETALRYCHYVDAAEHTELVAAAGMHEIETYRADGFTGTVNGYSILRKQGI